MQNSGNVSADLLQVNLSTCGHDVATMWPSCLWGIGAASSAERIERVSILGELGRLSAHDPGATSAGC